MSYHGDSDDTVCVDPRTGEHYHNPCAADMAMQLGPDVFAPQARPDLGSPERRDEGDGWYV